MLCHTLGAASCPLGIEYGLYLATGIFLIRSLAVYFLIFHDNILKCGRFFYASLPFSIDSVVNLLCMIYQNQNHDRNL